MANTRSNAPPKHPGLEQWRSEHFGQAQPEEHCTNPALARFLAQSNVTIGTAANSPGLFSGLSPLATLHMADDVLLDGSIQVEGTPAGLRDLSSPFVPQGIFGLMDVENVSDLSSEATNPLEYVNEVPAEVEESPRRSLRCKTKRGDNATSTRSQRHANRTKRVARDGAARAPTVVRQSVKQRVAEIFDANPVGESHKCMCKRSKCLKLYCECFSSGVLCDAGCKCTNCSNTAGNVTARRDAVTRKLKRRPDAFQGKILSTQTVKDGAVHLNGCKCKRSGCQKKYCECFQAGVACGDSCKCIGCKNTGGLMHLRDLGVKGWEPPRGGFSKSQHGVMSTMIIIADPEEAIPDDEAEVELQEHLDELQAERQAINVATGADTTAAPLALWPVVAPPLVALEATPRSGTPREPKRTCRKNTPKSFDLRSPTMILSPMGDVETDGWLVALGGALNGEGKGPEFVESQIPQTDGEFEVSLRSSSENLMDNTELLSGPWSLPTPSNTEETQLRDVEKAMSALMSPHGLPLSIAEDMEIDFSTPLSCRSKRPEAAQQCCAPPSRRGTTPRSCMASPRSASVNTRSRMRREYVMDVAALNDDGTIVQVL